MKIILANPRGFCAGVNMAIESLERALALFGTPIYVYHEIVHNRPIVERFRDRGVVFVDDIAEVPDGGTVLYSAHGVSPVIREHSAERNLRAIDATCPLVTKVHIEAVRFAREGYTIVLIGHEGHDEVIGTMGEAPANMVLVEDAEDVEALSFSRRREARVPDADDAERGRGEGRHRRAAAEVPADRRPEQGRHLLRDAEPPGGGARPRAGGRRGARARQPEQLEQPAAGGDGPRGPARPRTSSTASRNSATSGSSRPTRC